MLTGVNLLSVRLKSLFPMPHSPWLIPIPSGICFKHYPSHVNLVDYIQYVQQSHAFPELTLLTAVKTLSKGLTTDLVSRATALWMTSSLELRVRAFSPDARRTGKGFWLYFPTSVAAALNPRL